MEDQSKQKKNNQTLDVQHLVEFIEHVGAEQVKQDISAILGLVDYIELNGGLPEARKQATNNSRKFLHELHDAIHLAYGGK